MIVMSTTQSRYLALLLLLFVVASFVSLLIFPYVSAYSAQAGEIDRKQRQITTYEQLAASEDALQQELALLKRSNPAAAYFVDGETPALASARMQQYVKQIIERNGGELISTQIVQQETASDASSTTLNVTLRTDVNASSQILYLLESGKPLLFLDKVTISTRLVRGTGTTATPQIALDMSFDVTGYLREGV